jgi:hypothetical protein
MARAPRGKKKMWTESVTTYSAEAQSVHGQFLEFSKERHNLRLVRMKKRFLIIVGVLLLLFVVSLLLAPAPTSWHPNIRLTFSRFSESSSLSNMQAEFLVTGVPPGDSITLMMAELNRKDGTNWKQCELELGPYDVEFVVLNTPRHYQLFALVPVETTNVPSQIIMEVKRDPKGLARRWRDLRERWDEFRGRPVVSAGTGDFLITNETVVPEPAR